MLHLQVFTGDDINAFISRSGARAQHLDPKSRSLLLISKGAKLAQPSSRVASIRSAQRCIEVEGKSGSASFSRLWALRLARTTDVMSCSTLRAME